MKKSELEHVIRAAKEITGATEFVIIGSQALHGAFPNLVDKLVTSHECDLYIPNSPEKTELLNSIGMLTPFAQTYGYYADPVDPDTAKLPKSWPRRRNCRFHTEHQRSNLLLPLPRGPGVFKASGRTGKRLSLRPRSAVTEFDQASLSETVYCCDRRSGLSEADG
ncbi:MAG: hypothetical protein WAM44_15525 [Chthoniobacterales bacterium]